MQDNIPDCIAIPLIIVFTAVALYRAWILPGYNKDRDKAVEQDKTPSE